MKIAKLGKYPKLNIPPGAVPARCGNSLPSAALIEGRSIVINGLSIGFRSSKRFVV